ncbi:hypothetical protein SELMODRAFT_419700 [Selaginella moellendorffii]|uniref:Uncharacterized protein n=1 Tax=Selaginella moellendorffii TaxID=88036 RepID=D8S9S3_SELML|nr:hypothetical protein SELMODRAFT_419700 [Selaginella moellendorffii]
MASSSLAVLCISLVVLSAGLVALAEDFKEDEYDIKHYVKSGVARDEYKTSVASQHHIYEDDNIGSMSGEEEESVKGSERAYSYGKFASHALLLLQLQLHLLTITKKN